MEELTATVASIIKGRLQGTVQVRLSPFAKSITHWSKGHIISVKQIPVDEKNLLQISIIFCEKGIIYSETCIRIHYILVYKTETGLIKFANKKYIKVYSIDEVANALDTLLEEMGHKIITQLW